MDQSKESEYFSRAEITESTSGRMAKGGDGYVGLGNITLSLWLMIS